MLVYTDAGTVVSALPLQWSARKNGRSGRTDEDTLCDCVREAESDVEAVGDRVRDADADRDNDADDDSEATAD